jgi:hypothetical protein
MSERQNLELTLGLNGVQLVEQGIERVSKAIERLEEPIMKVGEAFAILGGGMEIGEGFHQVLEYGRSLEVLQAQTGATIPDLVALERVLMMSGLQADEAGMMIARMQRALVSASEDASGPAFAAFRELFGENGIGAVAKMDTGGQFRAIGTALEGLGNSAKKASVAEEIFGRNGYVLLRMFPELARWEGVATQGHEEFANVMSRDSEMFRGMEVGLQMFGQNSKEFFAGVLDSMGSMFEEAFDKLGQIDLTSLGEHVGAFFGVIIQSVKDDKFPEMIGLLVEAGFELGKAGAERVFMEIVAFAQSNLFASIGLAFADFAMTFGVETTKLLVVILREPVIALAAGFDWVFDHARELAGNFGNFLKTTFAVAVNYWAAGIENLLNKLKDSPFFVGMMQAVNPGIGASLAAGGINLGRMNEAGGAVTHADSFGEDYSAARKAAEDAQKGINGYLDDRLKKSMEILRLSSGITALDKTDLDAWSRLAALINAFMAKRQALGSGEGGKNAPGFFDVAASELILAAEKEERLAKERIVAIDEELARVETDYTKTTAEKYAIRKKLLEDEKKQLKAIIDNLEARAALQDQFDAGKAEATRGQVPGVQRQMAGVDKQKEQMGPDPNSFTDQWLAALTKLQNKWGTLAQTMATTFTGAMTTAIASVSDGLTKMITTTQRWNLILYNVARTIMTDITNAIIHMAMEWITQHILMAAIGKMLQAIGVATTTAANVTIAATAVPAATMNTIATSGGAAAAAPAAIGTALGTTMSFAFAEGGYTGDGGKYDMAGIVHRGEFVMPADAVSRIGLPRLTAMKDGSASMPRVSGGGETHLHFHTDHAEAVNAALKNDGNVQHTLIGLVQKRSHMIIPRQS